MENEKLRHEPAFAAANDGGCQKGMSKRFYAACAAMQGILANSNVSNWVSNDIILQRKEVAITAFKFADELLKQENT